MEGAHTIAGVKAKSRSMRSDSEAPSSGSTQGALLSILPFSDREHGVSSFAQVSELPCASKAPLALRGGPLVLPHTTGTRPLEVAPSRRRSPEEKGGWGGGGARGKDVAATPRGPPGGPARRTAARPLRSRGRQLQRQLLVLMGWVQQNWIGATE